jgi:hypothetical protein
MTQQVASIWQMPLPKNFTGVVALLAIKQQVEPNCSTSGCLVVLCELPAELQGPRQHGPSPEDFVRARLIGVVPRGYEAMRGRFLLTRQQRAETIRRRPSRAIAFSVNHTRRREPKAGIGPRKSVEAGFRSLRVGRKFKCGRRASQGSGVSRHEGGRNPNNQSLAMPRISASAFPRRP